MHRDLYADNIVVADATVAGIIDFEHAKIWDPMADFAKIELLLVDGDREGLEAVVDGYRAVAGAVSEMEARRALGVGLEMVWGLPFYVKHQHRAMVDDWTAKLRRWSTSTQAST